MDKQFLTADLYDEFGDRCNSCETQFKQFGGRRNFYGLIRTVKCIDDNVLVKSTLQQASKGEVLVVDAGGFLGSAMVGDVIAGLGQNNGWAGVVVFGAVRDTAALGKLDFGIKALGSNPKRSAKNGTGKQDIPVSFGGVVFTPGHWLYSDDDGILITSEELI